MYTANAKLKITIVVDQDYCKIAYTEIEQDLTQALPTQLEIETAAVQLFGQLIRGGAGHPTKPTAPADQETDSNA